MTEKHKQARVVAIDPAPGKNSTLFDGKGFKDLRAPDLRKFVNGLHDQTPDTLVCWDAPLTGPADPSSSAGTSPGDFTKRPIERFFSLKETGFNTPKGISVLGYAGCQHWTISRSLLGLPRTGPYDQDYGQLPFHLVPGPERERTGRASIIEIHPAVAAWLWCRKHKDAPKDWRYKNKEALETRETMWRIILEETGFSWSLKPPTETDDRFDAAVGYILGSLYADERTRIQVTLLGSRKTGSFLLPAVKGLERNWNSWIEKR